MKWEKYKLLTREEYNFKFKDKDTFVFGASYYFAITGFLCIFIILLTISAHQRMNVSGIVQMINAAARLLLIMTIVDLGWFLNREFVEHSWLNKRLKVVHK